jgi:chromosomal replication initiator protein
MTISPPGAKERNEAAPVDPWASILGDIQGQVSPEQFERWIRPIRARRTGAEAIELTVKNDFARERVMKAFAGMIRASLTKCLGWKDPVVTFEVANAGRGFATESVGAVADAATAVQRPKAPTRTVDGGLQLNPDYTLDAFVVGPHNELAEAAARAVVKDPGRHYNPLFVHGRCGLGKTHLLQGLCHEVLRERPETRVAYVSCEAFINQFIAAVEKTELDSFRSKFRKLDVLIIDDVHFLANKERSQEEFFHTFNDLHQLSKQIVLSSDVAPPEIPSLSERLVSRFRQGMVVHLDAPVFETRLQIAKKKAETLGVDLPDDVAEFIARNVQASIRDLCGAVVKVLGVATLMKVTLSVDMARSALGEVLVDRRPRVTLDSIVHAVTEHFALRRVDLQSKRRTKPLTVPRQICMFLGRKLTNLSLEEIGAHLGGRDHSTVLYGADRVAARYATDPDFKLVVDQLATHSGGSLRT